MQNDDVTMTITKLILDVDNNILQLRAALLKEISLKGSSITSGEINDLINAYENLRAQYMMVLRKLTEE